MFLRLMHYERWPLDPYQGAWCRSYADRTVNQYTQVYTISVNNSVVRCWLTAD